MRRHRPAILAVALLGIVHVNAATAAAASPVHRAAGCPAPTIEADRSAVQRGSALVVAGYGWAPCVDFGPQENPDEKQIAEVELHLVQQDAPTLVARGMPSWNGRFEVTITVPSDLLPGGATLDAGRPGVRYIASTTIDLVVTDEEVVASDAHVATFAPSEETPTDSGSHGGGPVRSGAIAIVSGSFAIGALLVMLRRRRPAH